jgi:hypothetical protein
MMDTTGDQTTPVKANKEMFESMIQFHKNILVI